MAEDGNGDKFLGRMIMALGVLAGSLGGAAGIARYFISPLEAQLQFFNENAVRLRGELTDHIRTDSHIGTASRLAEIRVQFVEVETRFREGRKLVQAEYEAMAKQIELLQTQLAEHRGTLDRTREDLIRLEATSRPK